MKTATIAQALTAHLPAIGKAWITYWPKDDIGVVPHYSYDNVPAPSEAATPERLWRTSMELTLRNHGGEGVSRLGLVLALGPDDEFVALFGSERH